MDESERDETHPEGSKSEGSNTKNMEQSLPESPSDDNDRLLSGSDSDSESDSEFICKVCSKKFSGYKPFVQHEKSGKHAKAILKKKKAKELLRKIAEAEKISDEEEYLFFIKKPFAVCQTCNKEFGGPESYQMHLVSKAHKQKVLQASLLDQIKNIGKINTDMLRELYRNKQDGDPDDLVKDTEDKINSLKQKDNAGESEVLECGDCQKSFTGMIPYTQHILSKVHAKTVEKKNLLEKLTHEDVQHSDASRHRDVSSLALDDGILICKLCSTTFSGPENAMMHLKSKGHLKNLEKFSRKEQRKAAKAASKKDSVGTSRSDTPVREIRDQSMYTVEPGSSKSDSDSSSSSDSSEKRNKVPLYKTEFKSSLEALTGCEKNA